jgi:hypothetical protein
MTTWIYPSNPRVETTAHPANAFARAVNSSILFTTPIVKPRGVAGSILGSDSVWAEIAQSLVL